MMIKSAAVRLALALPALLASIAVFTGCSAAGPGETADQSQQDEKKPSSATVARDAGSTEEAPADVCARLCARETTCDPKSDQDTCNAKCKNKNATFLEKLRTDYANALASCIDQAACKEIDDGTAISTCVDESSARVSVTTAATELCDAYAASATKCGQKLDKADCYNGAKIYSDATLAEAQKCFGKKCADVDACVSAALGNTSSSPPPPPPPPPSTCSTKMSYSSTTCGTCVQSACCAEDNACANNPSCGAALTCISNCTTTACMNSCVSSYPTGASLLSDLATCMDNKCPASCGN